MHFRLLRERTLIGASDAADLVLCDREVSSPHCEILRSGTQIRLVDHGSRAGTFLDGARVSETLVRVGQTLRLGQTKLRLQANVEALPLRLGHFGIIAGGSPAIRAAIETLERAAGTDTTVLLEGETGTGKELAAEFVHRRSARRAGPFVVVDCASIPAGLIESELFGHERGSFTGAVTSHAGAFEVATGGTVFLDELSELPPELQPKLLRVLEKHEVKRIGSNTYVPVQVRLVAASSRRLAAEVRAGRFRSELYYRLAVLRVTLPALRQRLEDLPVLVEHLLRRLGRGEDPEAAPLRTEPFLAGLALHDWPGNVRELRNHVERCLAIGPTPPGEGELDEPEELRVRWSEPFKVARAELMRRFERQYLREVLARHPQNVSAAARDAGVDRVTFYRMLSRHGLRH